MKGAVCKLKELRRAISYIKQFVIILVKEHSSLETYAQSGAFCSVVHHVRRRAISVISELKAIWTHSPPKLDKFSPKIGQILPHNWTNSPPRGFTQKSVDFEAHVYFQPTIHRCQNLVDFLPLSMPFCAFGAKGMGREKMCLSSWKSLA